MNRGFCDGSPGDVQSEAPRGAWERKSPTEVQCIASSSHRRRSIFVELEILPHFWHLGQSLLQNGRMYWG